MAYVPPALRRKQQVSEGAVQDISARESHAARGSPRDSVPRVQDIYEHFWPIDNAVQITKGTGAVSSTLHSSVDDPNTLKYVTLFHDANPRWASDKIVFAKTNLDLLPVAPGVDSAALEEDSKFKPDNDNNDDAKEVEGVEQQQTRGRCHSGQDAAPQVRPPSITAPESTTVMTALGPIPIFEQAGDRKGGMRFIGYHKLVRVQFLEPRSADLVSMLEMKWSRPDRFGNFRQIRRDSDKWLKSLGHRWAVLKFEYDEEANARFAPPDIKINADRETRKDNTPKKSVNELLREMRLGKDEAQTQADGEAATVSDDKPA